MTVILLTVDLAVISRVEGVASRMGASVRSTSSESAAVELCVAEPTKLLIADLNLASLNVVSLVEQVKAVVTTPPRIIAFGPHVHEERLAAAREAGCDEVISRGQFFAQLDALVGAG
ncbi:MAG: hypothetical protein L0228_13855 [Planctomycetes bacterium]|nr:hypothetical protein [Planctomycetota bacterium]